MTTVAIELPDQLAQEAERAGLLSSQSLEQLLRAQLRQQSFERLHEVMDRAAAMEDPSYMSPEEIALEVRAYRAEKRAGIKL